MENKFDNIVSRRDKLQDINIDQIKLEVHDTHKKDEKLTKKFKLVNHEDVINESYQDEKMKKIDGHIPYIENEYSEFKLQYNKQSVEEGLIQGAVKTTIPILYDNGLFDIYANSEEVLKDFFYHKT